MRTLFRILAIALALFILAGVLGDIFGFTHSRVAFTTRFHRNFIPIVAAILLLVPAKSVKSGFHGLFFLIALFAVNCWYSMVWMNTFSGFLRGHTTYRVLPIGLLMMAILWGTFWMAANQYSTAAPKKRKA